MEEVHARGGGICFGYSQAFLLLPDGQEPSSRRECDVMDMSEKTDKQIQNLIENHRRAGKLDAPLAVAAIEEQGRRNKAFNFKAGIEFLLQAARDKRPVNYRQLAEAGGVLKPGDVWHQHMARKIPLSHIVDYAHTHDLPAITALIETTQGVTDSILAGFQKGLEDTGIRVPSGMSIKEFYLSERERAFDWAASQEPLG